MARPRLSALLCLILAAALFLQWDSGGGPAALLLGIFLALMLSRCEGPGRQDDTGKLTRAIGKG